MDQNDMKRLIMNNGKVEDIRKQAKADGMATLKQDGILKVFNGDCDLKISINCLHYIEKYQFCNFSDPDPIIRSLSNALAIWTRVSREREFKIPFPDFYDNPLYQQWGRTTPKNAK
jgi:hypothetical protein